MSGDGSSGMPVVTALILNENEHCAVGLPENHPSRRCIVPVNGKVRFCVTSNVLITVTLCPNLNTLAAVFMFSYATVSSVLLNSTKPQYQN